MLRSMMQIYVKGSFEAAALYQKAFGAKITAEYKNDDEKSYMHAELDVFGQVLSISEALPEDGAREAGTTMQFCLHLGEGNEQTVKTAYDILKDNATIICPLEECSFSPLMFALIDKFGVNWGIFV